MCVFCFISVPERLSILEKAIESCMDSQRCTGVRKKDIPDYSRLGNLCTLVIEDMIQCSLGGVNVVE